MGFIKRIIISWNIDRQFFLWMCLNNCKILFKIQDNGSLNYEAGDLIIE